MTQDGSHGLEGGGIRYAQVWEDHRLLEEGLAVGADDDVLSITSAGDNALALLLAGARRVVAIDVNPTQQALLELKLAAARALTHAQFAVLLGARPGDRTAAYRRVRPGLGAAAQRHWDAHPAELVAGLLGAGRYERFVRQFVTQHLVPRLPEGGIDELLAAPDLDAQAASFSRVFERTGCERIFRAGLTRDAVARDGRSEEQFRFVPDLDVGALMWARFRRACTGLPIGENFYLEYILTGAYRDLETGPPYLRPSSHALLAERADRVELVTADLADHLAQVPAGTYSKANLSDVLEYLSEDASARLLESLGRALRPRGRYALWNLFVPRSSSPGQGFRRLEPLSDALARRDRSWFYGAFHVEEVVG